MHTCTHIHTQSDTVADDVSSVAESEGVLYGSSVGEGESVRAASSVGLGEEEGLETPGSEVSVGDPQSKAPRVCHVAYPSCNFVHDTEARRVKFCVCEDSYSSQTTKEGSESTLLVATLWRPFVARTEH